MGKLRQAQTRRQRVNKWFHRDSFLYFPFAGIVCRIGSLKIKTGALSLVLRCGASAYLLNRLPENCNDSLE
jgi:hypothetical protein